MAKCGVTNVSGGGGIGSDEVSVTKEYVLDGKTYVGADTDDEIGIGKMANNGTTTNQSLNASGSFYIKKGYHAQDFTVIANSLASQTSGTAIPSHVLNGETYWTNGNKSTGSMSVQSILSFSCAPYSASQLIFTWQNPSIGPFSGVIIIGKTGGYPANINDGTRHYKGFGNNTTGGGTSNVVIGGFGVNVTYYFRAFSYTTVNGEEWVTGTTRVANTIIQQVSRVFTSSGTFVVPPNVSSIDVFCVGGGGSGSGGGAGWDDWGGGGGGGYTTTVKNLSVTPNGSYSVIVGAGGEAREDNVSFGMSGFPTSFGGTLAVANGGQYGGWFGGNGGSGAGGGASSGDYWENEHADGGWGGTNGGNGSAGASGHNTNDNGGAGGTGQGFTTTAFAEYNGTVYSGGGGGGGGIKRSGRGYDGVGGYGGNYGGGMGGGVGGIGRVGQAGTPNSGGGSGGGGNGFVSAGSGQGGSGICIVRYIS